MQKLIFSLLFIYISAISFACQCPLTQLNVTETNKYDIIFKGKINAVTLNGQKSEAIFTIEELYKGVISQNFKIYFDTKNDCNFEMRAGDEWIIYANYYQVDNAKLDFCSRSRYFIKNTIEDFFTETTGLTYDDELRYLKTNLGLHKIAKASFNKAENRNIIPTQNQFIITLLISLLGIIVFIWITKRFLKGR